MTDNPRIHKLLLIVRLQEIDLFFTERGFSRKYICERIVYPMYFIPYSTYSDYLRVNAKKMLREKFDLDWKEELKKYEPVDFMKFMNTFSSIDLMKLPEYLEMVIEGTKR